MFRRLAFWVGVVVSLAVGGLWASRGFLPQDLLARTNDSVGNYLQTLGTIYAVLLAFVVYAVWTQFNETRTLVEREANDVVDVFRTTQGLPEPIRSTMRDHLESYVDDVLKNEWPAMSRCDLGSLEAGGKRLDAAWSELRAFEPANDRDTALFTETLGRFNHLFDVRTLRLTSACQRVPLALRLLLHTGALMVIASLYLFAVESFAIHILITVATAGAISHILYIVDDLDNCFAGEWQISPHPFERARGLLRNSR
jgi:hypothetical protein